MAKNFSSYKLLFNGNKTEAIRINSQRDAVTGRHGDQGKRGVEVEVKSKIKDQTCLSGRQGKKIKGQD
jgi:hypothetical protein